MIEQSLQTLAPFLQGAFAASCLAALFFVVMTMLRERRRARGERPEDN